MPTAHEVFQQRQLQKYEPLLRGVIGTYLFEIERVRYWFISVRDGAISLEEIRHDADRTISCNEPDFIDIVEGRRSELKQRFNRDFCSPEKQFLALALDGQKRKVDSLTSNIGHLLWSGIVDENKAAACASHLVGPRLFSGWGVRTMADDEGALHVGHKY